MVPLLKETLISNNYVNWPLNHFLITFDIPLISLLKVLFKENSERLKLQGYVHIVEISFFQNSLIVLVDLSSGGDFKNNCHY